VSRGRRRELRGTTGGGDVRGGSVRLGAGLEVGLDDVQVQNQVGGYIIGGHMVARMREEDVFQCQRLTSNYVRDSAYQDGAGGLLQGDTDGHTNEVGHDVVC